MTKKGSFIVIEGADGSGKTTQSKLLVSYLRKQKIPTEYISFPRYETKWGKMIRKYLDGKSGSLDPYEISSLYANDRKAAAGQIRKWIRDGKVVVANRYVWSNAAHMGAKFKSQSEKSKYIDWLEKLEYVENGIPKEDVVVFLYVPISVTKKLMIGRNLDIHEKDLNYQEDVLKVYDLLAKRKSWIKVQCALGGEILSKDDVQKKVIDKLKAAEML